MNLTSWHKDCTVSVTGESLETWPLSHRSPNRTTSENTQMKSCFDNLRGLEGECCGRRREDF